MATRSTMAGWTVGLITIALVSWTWHVRGSTPAAIMTKATPAPASAVPGAISPPKSATDPLAGFTTWDAARRMAVLAKLSGDPRLDPAIVAVLRRELSDRSLDAFARNSIANVLIAQDAKDPTLPTTLMAMVDDRSESLAWRDYALQHLARTVSFSTDPQAISAKLIELAKHGEATLPGTALLQLAELDRIGAVKLGADYDGAVMAIAADPAISLDNRMTAVGLIGQCQLRCQAPAVRALITTSAPPALVRVAIATLGLVGDASDVPMLSAYLTDRNRAVALAAQSALARLKTSSAL